MRKEHTTISLSEEAANCLRDASEKMGLTIANLAVLCLKLQMHRSDISLPEKVDGHFPKGTVTYNPLPAVRWLHIKLEPEEHMRARELSACSHETGCFVILEQNRRRRRDLCEKM